MRCTNEATESNTVSGFALQGGLELHLKPKGHGRPRDTVNAGVSFVLLIEVAGAAVPGGWNRQRRIAGGHVLKVRRRPKSGPPGCVKQPPAIFERLIFAQGSRTQAIPPEHVIDDRARERKEPMQPLTKRQREIYDYIAQYIKTANYAPSLDEIRSAMSLRSLSVIHKHLEQLKRKGYITRTWNCSRSMTLTLNGKCCPTCGRKFEAKIDADLAMKTQGEGVEFKAVGKGLAGPIPT